MFKNIMKNVIAVAILISAGQNIRCENTHFEKNGTSLWVGHAISSTKGSVSYVSATWTVPNVNPACPPPNYCPRQASFWVGIGGFVASNGTISKRIQQIGVDSNWMSNGEQKHWLWYEMYPKNPQGVLTFLIEVGDVVTASSQYIGNSRFRLKFENHTKNTIFQTTQKDKAADRSTAEIIVEGSPTYPLSNFSPVVFSSCTVTINGITKTFSGATKVNQLAPNVTVSNLSGDGTYFSVSR